MKIIAHGNGYEYTVNYIEFERNGDVKHILGFMDLYGKKDYPIGAAAECMELYENVTLTISKD